MKWYKGKRFGFVYLYGEVTRNVPTKGVDAFDGHCFKEENNKLEYVRCADYTIRICHWKEVEEKDVPENMLTFMRTHQWLLYL